MIKNKEKYNEREFISILKQRFENNISRHKDMEWRLIQERLESNPEKLYGLYQMEISGGEPDVVAFDISTNEYSFFDCSEESPKGRRSLCYDQEALDERKENKPKDSAMNRAKALGIEILDEKQYHFLQKLGNFDQKTSSWLKTPKEIRKLGGAIFADFRYNQVFIYHNGAQSYYAVRGFRGCLKI
ncbi:conserved hypothetical protein [Flavobacterium sp. 9AF]|uniref:DUF4256 domain-containing protein n=1 Tax=Flavobacterium sp. 9AF TaxID=2653142 RepID=UPI0012F2F44A|nr:DUF4256 domain-containing protein [Flavobacterium sp. 9AF]VXC21723.1 conserved hypothetical protein [Flavobacterium sp. 9AF]